MTSGLDYEYGEVDIPRKEHPARRKLVNARYQSWTEAADRLDADLSKEISAIWRRIRRLEAIAMQAH